MQRRGCVWLQETRDYTRRGMSREHFTPHRDAAQSSITIPLFSADFGDVQYAIPPGGEVGDLELVYQLNGSHFIVRSSIAGKHAEPYGCLRISNVQAVDLSLTNETPGLLEGLLSRLVVETSSDVEFLPLDVTGHGDEEDTWVEEEKEGHSCLQCRRITLTASIHECGHLRDIVLFLNSGTFSDEVPRLNQTVTEHYSQSSIKGLTIGLPHWILYIPWWLYSGRLRKCIQMCLVLYTIFSVVWASWQLYRHLNIIQVALQPIVSMLKVYLSSVMLTVNIVLEYFTEWWTSFLSPLNVFFREIAIRPLVDLMVFLISPLILVFGKIRTLLFQSWIVNVMKLIYPFISGLASLLAKLFLLLVKPLTWIARIIWLCCGLLAKSSVVKILVKIINMLLSAVIKPLSVLAAKASYSPEAILRRMGMSEFKNNFIAIGRGVFRLFKTRHKLRSVTPAKSPRPALALTSSREIHHRNIPLVYGSPLGKEK